MYFAMVVLLLALVQGVCEFLPISSSGHLLVLGHYFFHDGTVSSPSQQIVLSVLLHAGTFLSILVVYRRIVVDMFLNDRRLLAMVTIATIPTAMIGLGIKICAANLETSLVATAAGFLVTALLLFCIIAPHRRYAKTSSDGEPIANEPLLSSSRPSRFSQNLSLGDALFIGLIQGIAVLPGFSRSGLTLAAGITRRLSQADAAAFSFLIALPALAGAVLVELIHPITTGDGHVLSFFVQNAPILTVAFFTSFIIGIISLKLLLFWLQQGKLYYWGYWLVAMSLLTLLAML